MQPLTPADVQAALDDFGLGIQLQFYDTSTATSQLAAENIGCALGQIVKSLAFIIDGQPLLVLTSGDQRIDDRKLAAMFGVGRKKVKMASAAQCLEIFGYAPGGVPPIAHRTPNLPIYIDESLQRYEYVYPAGGASNSIFELRLEQLVEITGGEFASVVQQE